MTPEEIQSRVDAIIGERKERKLAAARRIANNWYARNSEAACAAQRRRRDTDIEAARAKGRQKAKAKYDANPEASRQKAKARYDANPEAARRAARDWRKSNPGKSRRRHLKRHYNMTPEEWDRLFASQGKACGVCKGVDPGNKNGWHTEHCHKPHKIRGITCQPCNYMVAGAHDSIENLAKGITYLADASGEDISEVLRYLQRYHDERLRQEGSELAQDGCPGQIHGQPLQRYSHETARGAQPSSGLHA